MKNLRARLPAWAANALPDSDFDRPKSALQASSARLKVALHNAKAAKADLEATLRKETGHAGAAGSRLGQSAITSAGRAGSAFDGFARGTSARYPIATSLVAAAAVVGAAAYVNWRLAQKAQRDNPPRGKFVEIDGVRLHYVERGDGRPLVLLHGNGSMIQDFESAGLIDLASQNYRVIVFDRPGFGHSSRPRNVIWSPDAQADLFAKALDRLDVQEAVVLGHSWGASVAIALAVRHQALVQALVLASGYYFPSARADVAAQAGPAIPGLGDILSYTLSPVLSRLMWPAMLRKLFGPRAVPDKFRGFPKAMAVRPSQIRASAAEAAMMIPAAFHGAKSYNELTLPIVIIVGEDDRLIDSEQQSGRLHAEIKQSRIHRIAGAGHMVQQSATDDIMAAIDEAAAA